MSAEIYMEMSTGHITEEDSEWLTKAAATDEMRETLANAGIVVLPVGDRPGHTIRVLNEGDDTNRKAERIAALVDSGLSGSLVALILWVMDLQEKEQGHMCGGIKAYVCGLTFDAAGTVWDEFKTYNW
jgi:hypothetical protein